MSILIKLMSTLTSKQAIQTYRIIYLSLRLVAVLALLLLMYMGLVCYLAGFFSRSLLRKIRVWLYTLNQYIDRFAASYKQPQPVLLLSGVNTSVALLSGTAFESIEQPLQKPESNRVLITPAPQEFCAAIETTPTLVNNPSVRCRSPRTSSRTSAQSSKTKSTVRSKSGKPGKEQDKIYSEVEVWQARQTSKIKESELIAKAIATESGLSSGGAASATAGELRVLLFRQTHGRTYNEI